MASCVEDTVDLRAKCQHFRILVIGRANAGKTTLLKKVCNSTEDPEIFNPDGEKIDLKVVEGSESRGEHDIQNQLIFKSNTGFIFHDSRGFESGSEKEIEIMKQFIASHAGARSLAKQLHAIWYCLPTDTNRPLLKAEEDFFNMGIAGNVPVIAIFTKFDGLENEAFTQLLDGGLEQEEITNDMLTLEAQKMLMTNFKEPLAKKTTPPTEYVQLQDMQEATSDCAELITKTAGALTNDVLRMLFVSVQQNNIDICIKWGISFAMQGRNHKVVENVLGYFPHVWKNETYEERAELFCMGMNLNRFGNVNFNAAAFAFNLNNLLNDRDNNLLLRDKFRKVFDANADACFTALKTQGLSPAPSASSANLNAQCITAVCILAEQIFTEGSALGAGFSVAFSTALTAYCGSQLQCDVNQSITALPWPDLQVAKAAYNSRKEFQHGDCNDDYCFAGGWEPEIKQECHDERKEHAFKSKKEEYECRLKEIAKQMAEIAISNRLRINGSA